MPIIAYVLFSECCNMNGLDMVDTTAWANLILLVFNKPWKRKMLHVYIKKCTHFYFTFNAKKEKNWQVCFSNKHFPITKSSARIVSIQTEQCAVYTEQSLSVSHDHCMNVYAHIRLSLLAVLYTGCCVLMHSLQYADFSQICELVKSHEDRGKFDNPGP